MVVVGGDSPLTLWAWLFGVRGLPRLGSHLIALTVDDPGRTTVKAGRQAIPKGRAAALTGSRHQDSAAPPGAIAGVLALPAQGGL